MLTGGLLIHGLLPSIAAGQVEPEPRTKVIFAGSATYPPFQWLDQQGQAKGFVIDLQESMAHHGGLDVEHRLMEWENALNAIDTGTADAVALFASEARNQRFDFTEPFYYLSHGIFSHAEGERFSSLAELEGHRVAVVVGSYAAERLAEEHQGMQLVPVNSEQACVVAIQARDAEACVEATLTSRRHAAELDVRQTSAPFWPQPYVFGVRKGNTELLAWLNHQLAMIQADGTYFDIYQQWLPELEWQKSGLTDSLRFFAWVVTPLFLLAFIGFSFSWYLKRQVSHRTRRLSEELDARRQLEETLRYQAEHDTLTGLPNRATFIDGLDRLLREERDWAPTVILLRLLNLEQLTCMFGYRFGHELLLQGFSHRLKMLDFAQVSHFGSGVFAILHKHDMPLEDIVELVSESFEINTIHIDAQVVMGISEGRATDDEKRPSEAEELVRRAMTAFSSAARAGKPSRIYNPELEPDPNDLILLRDFRRHGTRDMFLLYQPKLDLASGYIQEAEALVRWSHPQLGVVSPGHFIPLLEETGLITQVTYWVIEEAMREIERCRTHGAACCISVNISPRDLMEGYTLVDFIHGQTLPGRPNGLCLEITETGVINDQDHAQEVIAALHAANIRCAVDDFGTGYASLSYLSKFSVDEVKLDRSFISNMLENERHHAIIASTITLAHKLGLKVTAEGVEDVATLQALAEMGCDTAQGYVISRPITEPELHRLMGRRHFDKPLGLPDSQWSGFKP
ncbi:putative bifunctional diguanylate cyclase/phosphodiesterase [Halomonas kalidii]|uniref:EAL domain-containing protein n=1 Tax=Halomonas kalidii TaxID=3043293 RepID=A0ABT6VMH4_9GAMM|nr:EAL domain-containing protein [Halomonas kalidii]MDI5935169.1 EAL domain-containing protein [Halomonas kalidii]